MKASKCLFNTVDFLHHAPLPGEYLRFPIDVRLPLSPLFLLSPTGYFTSMVFTYHARHRPGPGQGTGERKN